MEDINYEKQNRSYFTLQLNLNSFFNRKCRCDQRGYEGAGTGNEPAGWISERPDRRDAGRNAGHPDR